MRVDWKIASHIGLIINKCRINIRNYINDFSHINITNITFLVLFTERNGLHSVVLHKKRKNTVFIICQNQPIIRHLEFLSDEVKRNKFSLLLISNIHISLFSCNQQGNFIKCSSILLIKGINDQRRFDIT